MLGAPNERELETGRHDRKPLSSTNEVGRTGKTSISLGEKGWWVRTDSNRGPAD
jgi:hypothetical protein